MDEATEPYFEWLPEGVQATSEQDIIKYALTRIEAQWHENGWDQPLAVGALFRSHMPELGASALSACIVPLPQEVVENPHELILFAQLIAQGVYQQEYRDDDFQRMLMLASIGHPDQDLEGPRRWMEHVLERGGEPAGWFSITEGFDGDVPENAGELDDETIRALPGVIEVRGVTYVSASRFTMLLRRIRDKEEIEVNQFDGIPDGMSFALGLLTAASLRMRVIMDAA